MNIFEKFVYHAVKRNPRIKYFLRDTYQGLCDFVPVPPLRSTYPIIARDGYFFGFHDKSPFSPDDSKLLAGKFDIPLRMPEPDDPLSVGFFTGPDHTDFQKVGQTYAWNWHQGCMLQWRGPHEEIIHNDFGDGRLVSRIHSIATGETRTVDFPIGAVSPDGRWGLSYSFPRVNVLMPGYGYANGSDESIEDPVPDDSGLSLVNLGSGESRFLFSIADIAGQRPEPSMAGARHYFSHCLFSPSSKRFVFLHRWIHGNVRQRWSRMISSDLQGKSLHFFRTEDMVSHIAWRDADHVMAYCRLPKDGDRYVLFTDLDADELEIIGATSFDSDGHPAFARGGRWFVTDTYPDRFRVASLILYDCEQETRYVVARLKSFKKFASLSQYNHWSCDLHPRWNRAATTLCFDSTYTGQRALCTLSLGSDVQQNRVRGL